MAWPHVEQKSKRKGIDVDMVESDQKRLKKNPIMELHERFQNIEYLFVQEGAIHEPTFKAYAVLNEKSFEGKGRTKQKAKLDLAIKALEVFGDRGDVSNISEQSEDQNRSYFESFQPLNFGGTLHPPFSSEQVNSSGYDFTSDEVMPVHDRDLPLYAPPQFRSPPQRTWLHQPHTPPGRPPMDERMDVSAARIMGPMLPPEAVAQGYSQLFTNRPAVNIEKARSYPVMVLCEIFPNMDINWSEGSGRGDRQFKVEAEVQGRRFFGEGRSKKIAKLNLAKTILLCMYDIHDFKEAEILTKSPKSKPEETQLERKFPLTQLKELVGDELNIEVVKEEPQGENDDICYHATVVVKGIAFEGVGKNRNVAKLRAAKKALGVVRPKKEGTPPILEQSTGNNDKKKKTIDTSRHPTMTFYELYRDVKFVESESKTSNGNTEYHMEAEVEGKVFKAKASSKKKAKLRLVISAFEELRDICVNEWTSVDLKDVLEDKQLSNNPATSHPIVLILKLNPQTRFDVYEDYECDASMKYKAIAKVGERDFNGEGPNKKTAKTMAAREALNTLYGIDPDNYVEEDRTDYFSQTEPKNEIPTELCNMITKAVQEQFLEVFQGETQCKVIAAFVLAKYEGINPNPDVEVVSIGTGTKCITGDQIDHKGQTLNDCHGEIIACRGFRQYLYDELLLAAENKTDTILTLQPNGKYALKSSVHLYLFVNTAPCGDGRVFTLQTPQQGAKNKTAGLLRTKIENGQGTIPVPENNIQTSDGILEGERLRTMSCSDKILKWNALGVQGALLSYFIEPIYLKGIVIGLHYHYDALCRALYKRGEKMDCTGRYALNKPGLGTPTNAEISRDTSKATSNSFNWYQRQKNVEAVNATSGKTVVHAPSRLCKLNFFDKFMQVVKMFKLDLNPKTYHTAKVLSRDHQKAKENFLKALGETTCGKWIGKPYEHDMFGY